MQALSKFEKFVVTFRRLSIEENDLEGFDKWHEESKRRIANGESPRTILAEELEKITNEMNRRAELN